MKFSFLLFMLGIAGLLSSQNTFNHRLHFGYPSAILSGVITTDSCYYATGIVQDTAFPHPVSNIFVKFDLEGNPVFFKVLTDPNSWFYTYESAFVKTHDHNFAVSGTKLDSIRKFLLIKYNDQGDTLFTRTYLHPLYPQESFVYLYDLISTVDGGFAMVGNLEMPSGINNTDILVIKTDSLGNEIFKKAYGITSRNDHGNTITNHGEGNILVGGVRNNTNVANENYTFQSYLLKLNPEGQKTWEYLTPTSLGLFDAANDMVLLEDGSIVVASGAGTELERSSVNDVWFEKLLFKLSTGGEIEWSKKFEEPELTGSAFTSNILKLSDNSGFVAAGTSAEELPALNSFDIRGWVGKVTLQGDSLWTREYVVLDNNNSRHKIYDMKECTDGGFILCGESRDASGMSTIPQQAWLLKLDEHGCLIPGCHLPNDVEEMHAEKPELFIYPNPVRDYLNFQLRHAGPVQHSIIRILDAEGRLMRSFPATIHPRETIIIPVWDWTPGGYFLQCLNDDKGIVAVKKFVVK